MWTKALDKLLRHFFLKGQLRITFPDGQIHTYGDGQNGPSVAVHLLDDSLPRKIVLSPHLAVGEGYMDGLFTIEDDDLHGFLSLAMSNIAKQGQPWFRRPLEVGRNMSRRLQQFNPVSRARANVAHHYDLTGELYDLFLDEDRQYSCAYFRDPDMTLEEAQNAKKHHIARKLLIKPGMRVLDIGCGWGGMGLTLARDYAKFELLDYREVTGQFDRIVSVGMFEHVGVPHYNTFFADVRNLLQPDGIALIHTIGRSQPPGSTSPWIRKYIFPGGYAPALSETMAAVEYQSLVATDIEVWRLHYAETLKHWYQRFMSNIDKAHELFDDRFCRMWRYYLISSELTFRHSNQVVFQLQLTRDQAVVPLTRDYLYVPQTPDEVQSAAE